MREFFTIRKSEDMPAPHAFGLFMDEVMKSKGITKTELESRTGISDSTLGRIINDGQEPTFDQFTQIVKGIEVKFWYAVQRAGASVDAPENASAEAQRLGAVFADDPELLELATILTRLSKSNRLAVLRMARSFLEEPPDPKGPRRRK